jgi:hypothetical protein
MKFKITLLIMLLFPLAAGAEPTPFVPPEDARVVNVRDFGAVGDGKADDTAAINAAIRHVFSKEAGYSRYLSPPFVYLPTGTYRVTGPIESKAEDDGWSGGWRAGLLLMGAGPELTTIRLDDRAPGYNNPQQPKAVIATGSESERRTKPGDEPDSGGGNRAFRHSVLNLAVDVGSGNPGAVGIDYVASNRGTIERVRLTAGSGSGHTGLKLTRAWPGPALVKDVTIDGFAGGVDVGHYQYSMTFEDLTLRNQREAGVVCQHNALFFHRLTSENSVPAVVTTSQHAFILIVDSDLTGGASANAAVKGKGELYLRDVRTAGYGRAVFSERKNTDHHPAGNVTLYTSESFGNNQPPLALDVADAPTMWDVIDEVPTSEWVNVVNYGATFDNNGDDDGPAIQAALDSGAAVVYLPVGAYDIRTPLTVPLTTRLLLGMQSAIKAEGEAVTLTIADGGDAPFVAEHIAFDGIGIVHDSGRAVAFRHVDLRSKGGAGAQGLGYRNTERGTGDMHFSDTMGPKPLIVDHGQRVFGRQVNIEFSDDPLIINRGGDLWLLGYKTEGKMVTLRQEGGRTELLGGLFYPLKTGKPVPGPAIVVTGGQASLSYVMNGRKYANHVEVGGETLTNKDVGGRSAALVTVDAD